MGSGANRPCFSAIEIAALAQRPRLAVRVVRHRATGAHGVGLAGAEADDVDPIAELPPLYPEWLGDRSFTTDYGLRLPIVAGAMANGIASPALVIALARSGLLGFFGAAGLGYERVVAGLDAIAAGAGGGPWGANLIHMPQEPALEARVAALFVARGVAVIEASAFMGLTPALVHVACAGLRRDPTGRIHRARRVIAKVSRPEVAARMLAPPPRDLLDALVTRGALTVDEARLAARIALVSDLTVESDSAGHTDNRPLGALFPAIQGVRDEAVARYGYRDVPRLGAAGGLGAPAGVASAFALGAAYVLTGSVNQAAVESGLSAEGRAMLAQAGVADVGMAPAADMFELGVKLQVLQRGTLFVQRANRLYEAYRAYPSIEALPAALRAELEQKVLGATLDAVWDETRAFWSQRDPQELARAATDPHHRMALCFRWYLGSSSRWAIRGDTSRRVDWQIWCGPAMGAFNAWTRGSFLEAPEARGVVQIAANLLEGAAVWTRAHQLRTLGVPVPPGAFSYAPRPLPPSSGIPA